VKNFKPGDLLYIKSLKKVMLVHRLIEEGCDTIYVFKDEFGNEPRYLEHEVTDDF
jgi:hypothetical protein